MVMMIALPFASELAAALVAALAVLFAVKRRPARLYDVEREIADLTLKVRKPWTYRARKWMGE